MKESGMTMLGVLAIGIFFVAKVYPNLEYTGYSSNSSCTGQCYVDYVALNGTASEIEQRKQALANLDEFSDIRSLWAGCAACHGMEGQGMAVFPKLAGQSSDYIVGRLNTYKNRGQVGAMSSTMWSQAGMLSADQMDQIGKFIEAGLPSK
jgi:cytochrome c553